MLAIAQVTEPGLQLLTVVFADDGSVGDYAGLARDGGPLARVVDEGHVDIWVGFEIVGFARFGVGVEDEINTAILLQIGQNRATSLNRARAYRAGNGHASRGEQTGALGLGGHHAELGALDELDQVLDLLFCTGVFQVLGLVSA